MNDEIMTIERLEQYHGLVAELKAIETQIEELEHLNVRGYNPTSFYSTTPSNPTEKMAYKLINLKERMELLKEQMIEEMHEINAWIETIDDGELRAILREHYCNGLDWSKTNFKVFGYYSYDTSRKKVLRYFGNDRNN